MKLYKFAGKDTDTNKYKQVDREAWTNGLMRANSGKSKNETPSIFDAQTKETQSTLSQSMLGGAASGSLIGGAAGAGLAAIAAKKLHISNYGEAAVLGGALGSLTGVNIGESVGQFKGANKNARKKGFKPSWGLSNEQNMTEEAMKKYLSEKEYKKALSKKANYKTEAIMGGLGAVGGYAGTDGTTGEKLKNAAGIGLASASAGHMFKGYGKGWRFYREGGGHSGGGGYRGPAPKSDAGHYSDFFNGTKDPTAAKKMFRDESRKVHPDLHPADKKEWATKRQKELNAAKEMFDKKFGR